MLTGATFPGPTLPGGTPAAARLPSPMLPGGTPAAARLPSPRLPDATFPGSALPCATLGAKAGGATLPGGASKSVTSEKSSSSEGRLSIVS